MRSLIPLVASMSVSELSSKPFIQKALSSPMQVKSVLSFFFGVDYFNNQHEDQMREGTPLEAMGPIWYTQSDDYDKLCQPFVPVIRAVGNGDFLTTFTDDKTVLESSVDGLMSQVILCDQLSRNCFRGTDEAFKYDAIGEKLGRQLATEFINQSDEEGKTEEGVSIDGEFYPPYVALVINALMHSEEMDDHQLAATAVQNALRRFEGRPTAIAKIEYSDGFLLDHTKVIEQFGRYPHRNAKLGRTSTPEEIAWLDDKENLPGWAKSQG